MFNEDPKKLLDGILGIETSVEDRMPNIDKLRDEYTSCSANLRLEMMRQYPPTLPSPSLK